MDLCPGHRGFEQMIELERVFATYPGAVRLVLVIETAHAVDNGDRFRGHAGRVTTDPPGPLDIGGFAVVVMSQSATRRLH
jgi:hypothetical protein